MFFCSVFPQKHPLAAERAEKNIAVLSMNIIRLERLGKATLIAACAAMIGSLSLLPQPAQSQRIILKCTPPLVANSDGTDCVRPAVQEKTPDRLTAFSIRTTDGRHLGLYRKTSKTTWVGPSLDSDEVTEWTETGADKGSLVLYTETPRVRTMQVYGDDSVASSGLPNGSVLGDRAY